MHDRPAVRPQAILLRGALRFGKRGYVGWEMVYLTQRISHSRILCYTWGMNVKAEPIPISRDPEAQTQWEAVIKAFHAEVLRKSQSAQARFESALRQTIRAAAAQERALRA